MADFNLAVEQLLGKEGGTAPEDNGRGAVNFGITHKTLKALGIPIHPYKLTREQAISIYFEHFWSPYRCGEIVDQRLAELFFEAVVNMGPVRPTKFLQSSAIQLGSNIALDGRMGPKTVAAVNALCQAKMAAHLRGKLLAEYERLAREYPDLYADDLAGWRGRLGIG